MNASEIFALMPVIAIGTGTVVVMLLAAFARSHASISRMTAVTLLITLATIPLASRLAPIGVTPLLIIDGFGLMFCAIILMTSLAVCLLAYPYWQVRDIDAEEFYLLLLIATLGAMILVLARHMVSLLLGLEILGVALFAMTAYSTRLVRSPNSHQQADFSLEAGLKYLVLSGLASALLLFGMALIYLETGQLDFSNQSSNTSSFIYFTGTALLLAGIGFKLSLFPFHLWTPDVYQGAPAPVSTFVATVSKGAIFALCLRYFVASDSLASPTVLSAVSLVAILSMIGGNLLALKQNDLKRLLAYSSIAHLGYLLIGFVALQTQSTRFAVEASSVYVIAYMLTSLVAFGIINLLSSREGNALENSELSDYTGLFWRHPGLALALTFALLSLAGIPLTMGFIGKFYLLAAGAEAGLWTLLSALIIGSGIGLYYYLRVIITLIKPAAENQSSWEPGPRHATSCAVLAVFTVNLMIFGVYPEPLIDTVQSLSASLFP